MSRRRRSHRGHTDSLDLLLGPMCNTFGGIVLMAVVLALLSREVNVTTDAAAQSSKARDNAEMLARRIAKAEDDLARAEAFRTQLNERLRDPALAERVKLAAERTRLRELLEVLRKAPHGPPQTDSTADPGVIAAELHTELADLVREKAEQENAKAALDENLARLQRRQADLAAQMRTEKDKSVRKLRLPKERAKTKAPFFVILRYGRVYPRAVFLNGVPEENGETIKRTEMDGKLLLEPRAGQGLDPRIDAARTDSLLRGIPQGAYYVSFLVYQDSFAAFNAVKQKAVELGLDYGWDAFANDRDIVFSREGNEPAPPL